MVVTVKWGRERISFDLPPQDTPLSAIRSSLAEYTHLNPDEFKLVHKGAIMKDDNAPISAYHLHPNSVIALIGSADSLPAQPHSQQPLPSTEQSVISVIHNELNKFRTELAPNVELFLQSLANPHPLQEKEHTRLGELLLQSLLRLDGVITDSEWENARRERKDAVREVQSLLDRLDNEWADRTR